MTTTPSNLEQEFDSTIQKAMQTWNIPGLALAIVKDDQVLLAKGYGIREINKPDRVDEHTLFAIGSNTKAFTSTALGLLIQEGKISWDDPVTKYLPSFKLYDEHTTQLITIRDLLCHRSGLGTWAGDILLLSKYPTEEIVQRLQHIRPEFGFRAGYGYSNLMFITAGLIISLVSGMSWDEFIRQRIFEPLGMCDSVTNPQYFGEQTKIATPHEDIKGKLQTVGYRKDAHVGAAGSICASAADIALWLKFLINSGNLDGRQIVNAEILEETITPHTPMRIPAMERERFPSVHIVSYGLGWFLSDYEGRFTVRHTGGVDGMLSITGFIPEEKLGVAILTNKLPNTAFRALHLHILDTLMGIPERNWLETYVKLDEEGKQKAAEATDRTIKARAADTRPSLALEKYAGNYDSLILGGASVSLEGSRFHIQLQAHESISGTLEHWHYDTFLCKWDDPVLGESLIPFITDGQGHVTEFHVKIREDWIDPVEHVFKKLPEPSTTD